MSSPENSVTREGMIAAADRMRQTLTTVRSERSEVEGAVTRLFGSFSGSAATTFQGAMTGWYGNVNDIDAALSSMIKIMDDGAQAVGKSDTETEDQAAEAKARMARNSANGLTGL
jgi:WXG100 family type VII secretion target